MEAESGISRCLSTRVNSLVSLRPVGGAVAECDRNAACASADRPHIIALLFYILATLPFREIGFC